MAKICIQEGYLNEGESEEVELSAIVVELFLEERLEEGNYEHDKGNASCNAVDKAKMTKGAKDGS